MMVKPLLDLPIDIVRLILEWLVEIQFDEAQERLNRNLRSTGQNLDCKPILNSRRVCKLFATEIARLVCQQQKTRWQLLDAVGKSQDKYSSVCTIPMPILTQALRYCVQQDVPTRVHLMPLVNLIRAVVQYIQRHTDIETSKHNLTEACCTWALIVQPLGPQVRTLSFRDYQPNFTKLISYATASFAIHIGNVKVLDQLLAISQVTGKDAKFFRLLLSGAASQPDHHLFKKVIDQSLAAKSGLTCANIDEAMTIAIRFKHRQHADFLFKLRTQPKWAKGDCSKLLVAHVELNESANLKTLMRWNRQNHEKARRGQPPSATSTAASGTILEALEAACVTGAHDVLEELFVNNMLLYKGESLNYLTETCARHNRPKLLKALYRAELVPSRATDLGSHSRLGILPDAMNLAAVRGYIKVFDILLREGCENPSESDITPCLNNFNTYVNSAVINNHPEMIAYLFKHKHLLKYKDPRGEGKKTLTGNDRYRPVEWLINAIDHGNSSALAALLDADRTLIAKSLKLSNSSHLNGKLPIARILQARRLDMLLILRTRSVVLDGGSPDKFDQFTKCILETLKIVPCWARRQMKGLTYPCHTDPTHCPSEDTSSPWHEEWKNIGAIW